MSSFYCYRFNSEAQFLAFAEEEGLITEDGSPILASHEHALDILGTITKGGEYDPDTGEVITLPTALSGWHVNYAGEPPEAWEKFLVTPEHPARVWA
jgi:hypothetical protein